MEAVDVRIERLRLRPGDIVTLHVPADMTAARRRDLKWAVFKAMDRHGIDASVVLVDRDVRLGVTRVALRRSWLSRLLKLTKRA